MPTEASTVRHKVRRAHRKTKTGCSNCKKRRIKCDETKPSCSNCAHRGSRCHYISCHPSDEDIATTNEGNNTTHGLYQPSISLTALPEMPMTELRLLHHFTTSAYVTLSSRDDIKTLWRVTVPKLAFENDCLMRAILAISSLHLSRLDAEHRIEYQKLAVSHYDGALRSSTQSIQQLSADNCHALFVCSELIFIFHLAHPDLPPNPLLSPNNDVAPWVLLLRGVRTIAYPFGKVIKAGVIGPLLAINQESGPEDQVISDSLRVFARSLETRSDSHPHLETYLRAMDDLRRQSPGVDEHGFQWVVHVDEKYVALLMEMKPEALVIFAHLALNVKRSDPNYWLEGWAERLACAVYSVLDEEHRLYIRPVLEDMGVAR